jgi:hypothetical protein
MAISLEHFFVVNSFVEIIASHLFAVLAAYLEGCLHIDVVDQSLGNFCVVSGAGKGGSVYHL